MYCSIYVLIWTVVLVTHKCLCSSPTQQVPKIQNALWYMESMVDRMDRALQEMHIYEHEYSPWSECSVTCGIGYKWRIKFGCTSENAHDCEEWLYCNAQPCAEEPKPKRTRYATCAVRPNEDLGSSGTVRGLVTFKQEEHGSLIISVNVEGFNVQPSDAGDESLEHGFHIHELGDLSGGCGTAGGHFNPKGVRHGGRQSSIRHIGDLGNIRQTPEGNVVDTIVDDRASLFGDYSILGRAVVIHRDRDDLGLNDDVGSATTGNAGPRLACCVIGVASGE